MNSVFVPWVRARYGKLIFEKQGKKLVDIFDVLVDSVWGHSGGKNNWDSPQRVWQKTPVALRPSLCISTDPSDNPMTVIEQWKKWMEQKPDEATKANEHFRFDTVDITRAAMTEIFTFAYADVKKSCLSTKMLPQTCGFFKNLHLPGFVGLV